MSSQRASTSDLPVPDDHVVPEGVDVRVVTQVLALEALQQRERALVGQAVTVVVLATEEVLGGAPDDIRAVVVHQEGIAPVGPVLRVARVDVLHARGAELDRVAELVGARPARVVPAHVVLRVEVLRQRRVHRVLVGDEGARLVIRHPAEGQADRRLIGPQLRLHPVQERVVTGEELLAEVAEVEVMEVHDLGVVHHRHHRLDEIGRALAVEVPLLHAQHQRMVLQELQRLDEALGIPRRVVAVDVGALEREGAREGVPVEEREPPRVEVGDLRRPHEEVRAQGLAEGRAAGAGHGGPAIRVPLGGDDGRVVEQHLRLILGDRDGVGGAHRLDRDRQRVGASGVAGHARGGRLAERHVEREHAGQIVGVLAGGIAAAGAAHGLAARPDSTHGLAAVPGAAGAHAARVSTAGTCPAGPIAARTVAARGGPPGRAPSGPGATGRGTTGPAPARTGIAITARAVVPVVAAETGQSETQPQNHPPHTVPLRITLRASCAEAASARQ
jgi:hypothetical protein